MTLDDAVRDVPGGDGVPARQPRAVDVAHRAGVSRATVSQILNDRGGRFTPATVARVRAAAAELGYVPSAAGRALVRGRSDVVLIVVPYATLPHLQDLVEVLGEELATLGLTSLVQFGGPPGSQSQRRLRAAVEAMQPAGVVDLGGLSPEDDAELRRLCPVIGTTADAQGAVSNHVIGRFQVEHLVARGCRGIAYAFLSDERGHPFDALRVAGAREACAAAGLPEPYLFGLPLDPDGAADALSVVLRSLPGRVGIAGFSDDVAMGAVFAAASLGLDVPRDVAVLGLGRSDLGQMMRPRLSSVWFDMRVLLGSMRAALATAYGAGTEEPAGVDFSSLEVVQGETT
ncbi:LacI family DNA-binding transcriptional regulator [Nocardioides sp. YIM 152588]|uniref:LacI family DNA-binding transcriptional regulator n=1 Tax=Nocardioides sp. YIM 152588 TaxID=3158259 RepID=UPI0032E3AE10